MDGGSSVVKAEHPPGVAVSRLSAKKVSPKEFSVTRTTAVTTAAKRRLPSELSSAAADRKDGTAVDHNVARSPAASNIASVTPHETPNINRKQDDSLPRYHAVQKECEKHVRFGEKNKNLSALPASIDEADTDQEARQQQQEQQHRFVSPARTMPDHGSGDASAEFQSPAPKPDDEHPDLTSPGCALISTSSSLASSAHGDVDPSIAKFKSAPTTSISVDHSEAAASPLGQVSHADDASERGLLPHERTVPPATETTSDTSGQIKAPHSPQSPMDPSREAVEEKKGETYDLFSDAEIEKYAKQMDDFIPESPKSREYMTTPTDFAVDYGKPSSYTGCETSNVLAWLQSPTAHGLFSPGGGLASLMNTPGINAPPTPRTPMVSTSFFFSDVANLPSKGDTPGKDGVKKSKAGISSIICISPLASTRVRTAAHASTPLDFRDIFSSPRERSSLPLLGDTPARNDDRKSRKSGDPSVDAVHLAERDILEDEDLSVLLQLASNTPGSKHAGTGSDGAVFRSPVARGEDGQNFPGLELPMIGNDGDGGDTIKARLQKKPGGRDELDSDTFGPPQLGLRTSSSSHGSAKEMKRKSSDYSKDDIREASKDKLEAAMKATAGPLSSNNPFSMASVYPSHPGEMHGYYPIGIPPGIPPNSTGSMRVVVGRPPPRRTNSKDTPTRPGSEPPPPPYRDFPHPPGSLPYPPPGMFGSAPPYPPYNHMPGARYPPYSHYPPPPNQMPMYNAQHPPSGNTMAAPKDSKKTKNPKGAPTAKAVAGVKRPPTANTDLKTPTPSSVPSATVKPVAATSSAVTAAAETGRAPAAPTPSKKQKKSPGNKKKKSPTLAGHEREKAAATIRAINEAADCQNDRAAALAAAILRGVTMRPSGKWQAQLYFAGKSRYIGVFDTREKAALAYEIAREKLKTGPADGGLSTKTTENLVNAARKAAFDGVNERLGSR